MERDDVIEYSLGATHSEEEGVKIRKKIYFVTVLLTIITIIEVAIGAYMGRATTSGMTWQMIKWGYIVLTLIKAGYIVLVFMHLGDEKKSLKAVILVPYILFIIYLIFICLYEALAVGDAWATYGG
jgi:cytochrome c oxidase subunit IV